uniref:Semaphorin 7A (JohnMiltonHagen blood group) n=1 Tax=Gadus morhua TaxID=8049 RepID=A0A8C4ZA85_GADMO
NRSISFENRGNEYLVFLEGDLYAAAPLEYDGSSLQFRRKAGSRTNVWMYDNWPTFVAASWVRRKEDRENEKIYIFFREKNSDSSPEADPWVTRVARVCKVDEGGSKRFFQNTWTSFLKARLVCGYPKESLYFNHLLDVYVLHADNWRDSRVYALFTSSWNSTAVCVYSMADIDDVFEKSNFKGYEGDIPDPRPGTVRLFYSLDFVYFRVTWLHSSIHPLAPFYVSSYNYTKLAVDRVRAADQHTYNVLLLATGRSPQCGWTSMILSSKKRAVSFIENVFISCLQKKLIVSFAEEVFILDLPQCHHYNSSCAECVLSRDPYCAWTQNRCTSTIMVSSTPLHVLSHLEPKTLDKNRQETVRPTQAVSRAAHVVPLGVPFYLSCPIDSYHATYVWKHVGGDTSSCQQMGSQCLHLIPALKSGSYGRHQCFSQERCPRIATQSLGWIASLLTSCAHSLEVAVWE